MLNQDEEFDKYVASFKNLKVKDKQEIVISLLKEDIAYLSNILKKLNGKYNILFNREILDMNKEKYTDDDFAEALFVYIYATRELIANYIDMKEDK